MRHRIADRRRDASLGPHTRDNQPVDGLRLQHGREFAFAKGAGVILVDDGLVRLRRNFPANGGQRMLGIAESRLAVRRCRLEGPGRAFGEIPSIDGVDNHAVRRPRRFQKTCRIAQHLINAEGLILGILALLLLQIDQQQGYGLALKRKRRSHSDFSVQQFILEGKA